MAPAPAHHNEPAHHIIPNWIIKDVAYILAPPIAAIYNSTVREPCISPSWYHANILPVPKTSLAIQPIVLAPMLSMVLQYVVVSWMRRPTVHSGTQYGYIECSSTTNALTKMFQCMNGRNTYARILLIDISKAFFTLTTIQFLIFCK